MIYRTFLGTYARIRRDNAASIRAAEKAGYIPAYDEDGSETVVMTSVRG